MKEMRVLRVTIATFVVYFSGGYDSCSDAESGDTVERRRAEGIMIVPSLLYGRIPSPLPFVRRSNPLHSPLRYQRWLVDREKR